MHNTSYGLIFFILVSIGQRCLASSEVFHTNEDSLEFSDREGGGADGGVGGLQSKVYGVINAETMPGLI